jgi:hypothetical protein
MHNAMKRVIAVAGLISILVVGMHHDAAAWWVSADFEAGAVGSLAQGASGFDEAGTETTFSADVARSGSTSAKMVWRYGTSGFGLTSGAFYYPADVPVGGEVWMLGYFYFADPWSWDASSTDECGCAIKTMRTHVRDAGGNHTGYTSVITNNWAVPYVNCETCDGMQGLNINQGEMVGLEAGRWHAIEMYVKFSPGDGIVRLWIDGQLRAEQGGIATALSDGDVMDYAYFMGYWNGRCGADQVMYVDDLVITTDTPENRDAAGNAMIGGYSPPAANPAPAAPSNLRVVY